MIASEDMHTLAEATRSKLLIYQDANHSAYTKTSPNDSNMTCSNFT